MDQHALEVFESHKTILVDLAIIPAEFLETKQQNQDVGFLDAQAGIAQRQLGVLFQIAVTRDRL